MGYPDSVQNPDSGPNSDSSASPLIEFRSLTKEFLEGESVRSVLKDVNGSIMPGEFVVLLGPSGSGKSTLLNLISGIDVPTSGEIIVDGTDISRLSERDRTLFRRRNIGLVFQFFNLIPTLNVWENLLLPLELNGLTDAADGDRISDLLESVGLSDRARSFPDRLSGGEQQRIAIARALVHHPKLLLADEPTGNLDRETGRAVMDTLVSLVKRNGGTMLVVTHSREVVELADRVLGIQGGTLVEIRKESALELAEGRGL